MNTLSKPTIIKGMNVPVPTVHPEYHQLKANSTKFANNLTKASIMIGKQGSATMICAQGDKCDKEVSKDIPKDDKVQPAK